MTATVPKTAAGVYARAALAVAAPLGIVLLSRSIYFHALFDAMWEIATARPATSWLLAAILSGLAILEWRYLLLFVRLSRVRWRFDEFVVREFDPAALARRRRTRFRAAACVLSTLVGFSLAEASFRVLEIAPPPPAPNPFLEHKQFDNTLNDLGIREKWDRLPDDDSRLRIAFLGDSIVYGYNVEPRESFCHLVESMLTDAFRNSEPGRQRAARASLCSAQSAPPAAIAAEHGVVTINVGFVGTAPGRQLGKYLALRESLRPQVVVHVVYPNDLGVDPHYRLREIYRVRDDSLYVGTWSYVLRYAERQVRYWVAWKRTLDYFRGGRNPQERAEAWVKFKDDVRATKTAVEEGGARYLLVLFPLLVHLHDYPLMDVHEAMREFTAELAVPYLDLLETFAGRDAEQLRASLGDEHPNALGHALAAERITGFLRTALSSSPDP